MVKFRNALVSVSNKEGLAEFLRPLVEEGLRVVSTGGTAKYLKEKGLPIVEVSEQTGFPEVMDGRVRTLHPKIHMALLARSNNEEDQLLLKQNDIEPFDLVIVNLYPFEEDLSKNLSEEDQVEMIDIGGPSLLRAAAKSFERIAVVCDPNDYSWIGESNELGVADRRRLAAKVFSHVASYDSMIANYFSDGEFFEEYAWGGRFVQKLRYGENPQQEAIWLKTRGIGGGLHDAEILQGKALSYNNILDLDAAISTVREFKEICTVGVKHNNPCGVALGSTVRESVHRALAADPISIFGGIVACNRPIDAASAEDLSKIFLECIVAPDFEEGALKIFAAKKNLRILKWTNLMGSTPSWDMKSIAGGMLLQSGDKIRPWDSTWKMIGQTPDNETIEDLMFAWKVCAHLKSNAISIVSRRVTLGLGMGQVNRVDAVKQAIERATLSKMPKENLVLASDAFFPFPDSIEVAAQHGIRWIIQPGGSVKDPEVEDMAKKLKVNMIMTGERHFRH